MVVSRKVPTFPNLAKLTMKNDFYTYAWLREDGTPYYIGKGRGKRAWVSAGRRGCSKPVSDDQILILKKNLTEEEAFKHEVYLIAIFGRKDLGTGILYNFTDGGEGSSGYRHKPEDLEKIARGTRGLVRSEETRRKISEAKTGTPPHNRGKKMPEEFREKMRQVARNRPPVSAETRRRMSEAQTRRFLQNPMPEEVKQKISKGKKQ